MEHITKPRPSWMDCTHLPPRKYAPPPEPQPEPDVSAETAWRDTPGTPHPGYVGVYLESLTPRRYSYAVLLPGGREIKGFGFPSPSKAAHAYDRICRERGVNLDLLNFGREEESA